MRNAAILPSHRGCFAGQGRSIHSCCASESTRRGGSRNHRERLSKRGMVDLFGMFRRRPAKRSPPGFARTRPDITSLEDAMDSLTNPVRDTPRTPREGVRDPAPPRPETRQETRQAEKPRPRARTNGAAAPRQTPRAGYLAVHNVEKG